MPPPLDLTGRRFGALVAMRRGRTPQGLTAWVCACDCGNETLVSTARLNSTDGNPRAIRACETCRSRPCTVCGTLFLKAGNTKTCGAESCRLEHRRRVNAEAAARAEERTPGITAQRKRAYAQKVRSDPVRLKAMREYNAAWKRARWRTLSDDEREKIREWARAYYHENRDRIRDRFQAWIGQMSPEQRADFLERARMYTRSYEQRRALADLMRGAAVLLDKLETKS